LTNLTVAQPVDFSFCDTVVHRYGDRAGLGIVPEVRVGMDAPRVTQKPESRVEVKATRGKESLCQLVS